jgi:hypothetical protein
VEEGQERDPIASEVSRRVSSILDVIEREATALRQEAKDEARRYMEYARRRADGLVAERQREIAELSGEIMERADRILRQLDEAEPVRAAFEDLVHSLRDAADRLARETGDGNAFVAPAFHEAPPAPPPTPRPSVAHPPSHVAPAVSTPPPGAREPDKYGPEPASQRPSWPSSPQPPFGPEQPAAVPAPPKGDGGPAEQASLNLEQMRILAVQMASSGSTRGEVFSHLREAVGMDDPDAILDEVFGAESAEHSRAAWVRPRTG